MEFPRNLIVASHAYTISAMGSEPTDRNLLILPQRSHMLWW